MINKLDLLIQLLHILVFGPFLIYVGLTMPKQDFIYIIVFGLGMFVIAAFIAAIVKEPTKQIAGWLLWHIIIIAGLLLWCGAAKTQTPRIIYSLLIALGFAAIGYHATRLIQSLVK